MVETIQTYILMHKEIPVAKSVWTVRLPLFPLL